MRRTECYHNCRIYAARETRAAALRVRRPSAHGLARTNQAAAPGGISLRPFGAGKEENHVNCTQGRRQAVRRGGDGGLCARPCVALRGKRRDLRHPRALRLGQEHDAQHARRARHAHLREPDGRRAGSYEPEARRPDGLPPPRRRLRVPVLQPHPRPHGRGEHRGRRRRGRRAARHGARALGARDRAAAPPLPARAVRRPAAARRHRARDDQKPAPSALR